MHGLSPSPPNGNHKRLTRREVQVLVLIAEGKTTKEIARELSISFKTTASHRTHIMSKLAVHNAVLLTHAAIRMGLIKA